MGRGRQVPLNSCRASPSLAHNLLLHLDDGNPTNPTPRGRRTPVWPPDAPAQAVMTTSRLDVSIWRAGIRAYEQGFKRRPVFRYWAELAA